MAFVGGMYNINHLVDTASLDLYDKDARTSIKDTDIPTSKVLGSSRSCSVGLGHVDEKADSKLVLRLPSTYDKKSISEDPIFENRRLLAPN
jgi:hypothetical protein